MIEVDDTNVAGESTLSLGNVSNRVDDNLETRSMATQFAQLRFRPRSLNFAWLISDPRTQLIIRLKIRCENTILYIDSSY